jgi:tetratricopeptide (TPR) repeat protein
MARRLGDIQLLRATLAWACSAFVNQVPPAERRLYDSEHLELAILTQDRMQAHRGYLRLVFDCAELGDVADMEQNIRAYEAGARELRQPQTDWPVLMLRAMQALMAGRFAESDELSKQVDFHGQRHRDFNASICAKNHRLLRFHNSERHADLMAAEAELRPILSRIFARQPHLQWSLSAFCQARAGLASQVRTSLDLVHASWDRCLAWQFLPYLAEPCFLVGDAEFAEKIHARLQPKAGSFWQMGPICMVVYPPCTQALGLLAMAMGRFDDAVRCFEDALLRSESIGLRSHLARLRYEYALALRGRRAPGDSQKARELLLQARELATELNQIDLLRVIEKQA